MAIKIQELIKQLASYTIVENSNISSQAKSYTALMRQEISNLAAGNDVKKQKKMIMVFMGGTILALRQDDCKYNYNFELYPNELYMKLYDLANLAEDASTIDVMYKIGEEALRYPEAFTSDIFKKEEHIGPKLDNSKPTPFFPKLKENADKIDLLIKFCNQAKTFEEPTMEIDDNSDSAYLTLQILGGFAAVAGITAVALAFTVLNVATMGTAGVVIAGASIALTLTGVGFFGVGLYLQDQAAQETIIDKISQFAK